MTRSNLRLWMCASILLGVAASASAQEATPCESDDVCGAGTFCSGETYDAGGSDDPSWDGADGGDDAGDGVSDDGGDGVGDSAGGDGTSDPGAGVSLPPDADPIIAEPPPAVIPGQCAPLPTGFCEQGEGCADGLTCVRGLESPGGCWGTDGADGTDGSSDGTGGDDGPATDGLDGSDGVDGAASNDAAPVTEPPPNCEPVAERYGSCELPSFDCTSDEECAPGLRCVVTADGDSCDREGNCQSIELKSCVFEPARCDDTPCAEGYECVDKTVPGECSGGDGGCDENGCWTDDSVCEPDTIVKVCRIAYEACESDDGCDEGEKCVSFSELNGDLSVPQHWGVEGPVKSCVPAGSVLVAQTAGGLPEAPRNLSDSPAYGGVGTPEDDGIGGPGGGDTGGDGSDSSDGNDNSAGDDGVDGTAVDGSDDVPSDGVATDGGDGVSGGGGGNGAPGDEGDDADGPKGSSCSVGFAGNDVSGFASIVLALGLAARRRRRRV